MSVTAGEVRQIVKAVLAEQKAVRQDETEAVVARVTANVLVGLGVDTSKPGEMQQDFAHLRRHREATQEIKRIGVFTAIGVIVSGVLGLIWLGYQNVMGR